MDTQTGQPALATGGQCVSLPRIFPFLPHIYFLESISESMNCHRIIKPDRSSGDIVSVLCTCYIVLRSYLNGRRDLGIYHSISRVTDTRMHSLAEGRKLHPEFSLLLQSGTQETSHIDLQIIA